MRIKCRTQFDITATGVRNRFVKSRMPFTDDAGQLIDTDVKWGRSRAQQSNWETINQLIQLRTLTENISITSKIDNCWEFEFDVVDPAAIGTEHDPVGFLNRDCDGVPMNIGLNDNNLIDSVIKTVSGDANTWFNIIQ